MMINVVPYFIIFPFKSQRMNDNEAIMYKQLYNTLYTPKKE